MCGLATARHHAARHLVAVHAQLGVHAGDDDVEAGQQLGLLVEAAVLEDVDLDAGEDAERRHLLVDLVDDVELLAQAIGAEPVGDGEPGRVVGRATMYSWPRSRAASAITSIGLPPSDQSEWVWQSPFSSARIAAPGPSSGLGVSASSRSRYDGISPASACTITRSVFSPTPGQIAQRPGGGQLVQLLVRQRADGVGGVAERLDAVGRLSRPLQDVPDAVERRDGVDFPSVSLGSCFLRLPRAAVLAVAGLPVAVIADLDIDRRRGRTTVVVVGAVVDVCAAAPAGLAGVSAAGRCRPAGERDRGRREAGPPPGRRRGHGQRARRHRAATTAAPPRPTARSAPSCRRRPSTSVASGSARRAAAISAAVAKRSHRVMRHGARSRPRRGRGRRRRGRR